MRGDVPGKELSYAIDGVISDALEEVFQVRLRIESAKLGRSCRAPNYAEPEGG